MLAMGLRGLIMKNSTDVSPNRRELIDGRGDEADNMIAWPFGYVCVGGRKGHLPVGGACETGSLQATKGGRPKSAQGGRPRRQVSMHPYGSADRTGLASQAPQTKSRGWKR